MQIVVNGERREISGPLTVVDLLQALQINPQLVVVEHNRRILKRPELAATLVQAEDQLEIVRIVGGGCGET